MAVQSLTHIRPAELHERWEELARQQPGRFPRDIAWELGVTEAELIACRVDRGTTRLEPRWSELLNSLSSLDEVKTVTRNDYAVIEKNGIYPEFQNFGVHSMFVGEAIDLRIALKHWRFAFAVENASRLDGQISRSIQFYAGDGSAIHKLFLLKDSPLEPYYNLVGEFSSEEQSKTLTVKSETAPASRPPAETIDRERFLSDWSELRDTHEFFSLLHKHRLARPDAMRLAEGRYTRPAAPDYVRLLLLDVAQHQIPIMIFAGNSGCLQVHKGPINKIFDWKGWLNVMDPSLGFHLLEEGIAEAWVVEKPTEDGKVFSLELFDSTGRDIASIFGVRKEDKKQEERWCEALSRLPNRSVKVPA